RHTRFSRDWSSDVCSSDLTAVDLELRHGQFTPRPCTRHFLFSMWYSNSDRKCLMKLLTGRAAASPSAQMVRPAMLSATEFRRSRSEERRVGKEGVQWGWAE